MKTALCAFLLAIPLCAQDVSLRAWPPVVSLDAQLDAHRVVVVATDAHAISREVTNTVTASFEPDDVARFEDGVLRPLRDGATTLTVTLGALNAQVKVTVRNAGTQPPVSFRNDVEPVLMRAGCNAGACHGAATGKNGFGLSLFGFDPAHDLDALAREQRGRRLDCADPDASLILAKPTGEVKHKGGKRFAPHDAAWTTLRDWIAAGASDDGKDVAHLRALRVEPDELVLGGPDQRARFVVTAEYDDGSLRDVTDLALLSSTNPSSVQLDGDRVVSAARGESAVLARFGFLAAVAQVIVLPDAEPWIAPPMDDRNEIDALVHARLRKLRIAPAPTCDDATFVRRIHLDLVGRLPTADEVRAFCADGAPDKRGKLIDTLLARPELADLLAAQWAELLRIEPGRLEQKGAQVYTKWLRNAFRSGVPFDRMVRELLTAQGSAFAVPQANYWVVAADPRVLAENCAQAFLGIRLQCAQCHNHPFERWTLDDYYGFASFFGQVGRKRGDDPRDTIVYDTGSGEVPNLRNGRVSPPRLLGGVDPKLEPGRDRRATLATWLTDKDNHWFAENVANRLWARLVGRGLVEPVDDVRVSNPASNPELHRRLGAMLVEAGFDLRALLRTICNSQTYQAAVVEGDLPAGCLAGATPRRLSAETLIDAIDDVTAVPTKFRGLPLGTSAAEIVDADPDNRFLELFGRPRRESVCACERREEPTLNQVLHLINGDTVEQKVRNKDGRVGKLLAAKTEPAAILDELFLSAYARPPRDDERNRILATVAAATDARAAWEDVLWAVLNSKEFLFWH
ncbi:MAG: DUF1549 and DUF1553 domain-containing protein [Planctomycetota bacterium]